jgi:uncharacterized Zn-binding protein involved in type VI secretion
MFVAAIVMLGESPAARIGDPTTRGQVLPPGAPTVLICGMPAARVGDLARSQVPKDAGVAVATAPTTVTIATGSPTVLIAGKSAARIGDTTTNGDKILVGCPTVVIGP